MNHRGRYTTAQNRKLVWLNNHIVLNEITDLFFFLFYLCSMFSWLYFLVIKGPCPWIPLEACGHWPLASLASFRLLNIFFHLFQFLTTTLIELMVHNLFQRFTFLLTPHSFFVNSIPYLLVESWLTGWLK